MQDPHPRHGVSSSRRIADTRSRVAPSSSRMLATYLADIEQMLDEHRWDAALRDAHDLPRIAVALADPQLRASGERCKAWCAEWIPVTAAVNESGLDYERVHRLLTERVDREPSPTAETIPSQALRRLRLRRHARSAPRGFNSERSDSAIPGAADAIDICTALVDAVRRWYAHSGCHDATTQANLARLAVLR